MEDVETMLPEIAPIRNMLIEGDLRPLYLAWLACSAEWSCRTIQPYGE